MDKANVNCPNCGETCAITTSSIELQFAICSACEEKYIVDFTITGDPIACGNECEDATVNYDKIIKYANSLDLLKEQPDLTWAAGKKASVPMYLKQNNVP